MVGGITFYHYDRGSLIPIFKDVGQAVSDFYFLYMFNAVSIFFFGFVFASVFCAEIYRQYDKEQRYQETSATSDVIFNILPIHITIN